VLAWLFGTSLHCEFLENPAPGMRAGGPAKRLNAKRNRQDRTQATQESSVAQGR
jgi:hypothetical protein